MTITKEETERYARAVERFDGYDPQSSLDAAAAHLRALQRELDETRNLLAAELAAHRCRRDRGPGGAEGGAHPHRSDAREHQYSAGRIERHHGRNREEDAVSLSKDEELELKELQVRRLEKHERRVTDVARALCFVARINDKYGSGVEPLARVLVDIAEGWRP